MKASTTLNGYMLIDDKKATVDQIDTIIAERDNALTQNAELVAQNENMKSSLIFVSSVFSGDNAKDHAEHIDWPAIYKLTTATPTQHLRDRDAEVGRAGFVACLNLANSAGLEWVTYHDADQYAEKVRRDEV